MTSLAKQLNQLKITTKEVARKFQPGRVPSLLFPFDQAANIDLDTIKTIGIDGIENLIIKVPSFQLLREKIFSRDLERIQREKLTPIENKQISELMKSIILDLSTWFLDENCQKVYEYLLRNFEVHRYEGDILISHLIQYHSTVYFVKLMQNIDLNQSKHWYFLEKNIKNGEIIMRETIAKQVILDNYVLENVVEYVISIAEKKMSENFSNGDIIIGLGGIGLSDTAHKQKTLEVNFITALISEILQFCKQSKKYSENLSLIMLKYVSYCLKSQHYEYYASGLLLSLQLMAANTSFKINSKVISAMIIDALQGMDIHKAPEKDVALFMIYVCQNEKVKLENDVFGKISDELLKLKESFKIYGHKYSILNVVIMVYEAFMNNLDILDELIQDQYIDFLDELIKTCEMNETELKILGKRSIFVKYIIDTIFNSLGNSQSKAPIESIDNNDDDEDNLVVKKEKKSKKKRTKEKKTSLQDTWKAQKSLINLIKKHFPDQISFVLQAKANLGLSTNAEALLRECFSTEYLISVIGLDPVENINNGNNDNLMTSVPLTLMINSSNLKTRLSSIKVIEKILNDSMDEDLRFNIGSLTINLFRTDENPKILERLLEIPGLLSKIPINLQNDYIIQIIKFINENKQIPTHQVAVIPKLYKILIDYLDLAYDNDPNNYQNDINVKLIEELMVETIISYHDKAYIMEYLKTLKKCYGYFFGNIKPSFVKSQDNEQTQENYITHLVDNMVSQVLNSKSAITDIELFLEILISKVTQAKSANYRKVIMMLLLAIIGTNQEEISNDGILGTIFKELGRISQYYILSNINNKAMLEYSLSKIFKSHKLKLSVLALEYLLSFETNDNTQNMNSILKMIKKCIDLIGDQKFIVMNYLISRLLNINKTKQLLKLMMFVENYIDEMVNINDILYSLITLIMTMHIVKINQIANLSLICLEKLKKVIKSQNKTNVEMLKYDEYYNGLYGPSTESNEHGECNIELAKSIKLIKTIIKFKTEILNRIPGALEFLASKIKDDFSDWLSNIAYHVCIHIPDPNYISFGIKIIALGKNLNIISDFIINFPTYLESELSLNNTPRVTKAILDLIDYLPKNLHDPYFKNVYMRIYNMIMLNKNDEDNTERLTIHWINGYKAEIVNELSKENQLLLLQSLLNIFVYARSIKINLSVILDKYHDFRLDHDVIMQLLSSFEIIPNNVSLEEVKNRLICICELMRVYNIETIYALTHLYKLMEAICQHMKDHIIDLSYPLSLIIRLIFNSVTSTLQSKVAIDHSHGYFDKINDNEAAKQGKKIKIYVEMLLGEYSQDNQQYQYIQTLKEIFNLYSDNIDNPSTYACIRFIIRLLGLYSKINYNYISKQISSLIEPLFTHLIKKNHIMQQNVISIFSTLVEELTIMQDELKLHPYIGIIIKLLEFSQESKGMFTNDISAIFKLIGNDNLEHIVYANIAILLQKLSENNNNNNNTQGNVKKLSKKSKKKTDLFESHFGLINNLIYFSWKFEENLTILGKLLQSAHELLISYVQRISTNFKSSKFSKSLTSRNNAKKIVNNFGLRSLPRLKSFVIVLYSVLKKSMESTPFMTRISEFLIKGHPDRQLVIKELSTVLVNLLDISTLISKVFNKMHSLKSISPDGISLENKSKFKMLLKRLQLLNKDTLSNLTNILHEDTLATLCAYTQQLASIPLQVKSKLLQILYDKLCGLMVIKANIENLSEIKIIIENNLIQRHEELIVSKAGIAYIQASFLVLGILIKKKMKLFTVNRSQELFIYLTIDNTQVQSVVLYYFGLLYSKHQLDDLTKIDILIKTVFKLVFGYVKQYYEEKVINSLNELPKIKEYEMIKALLTTSSKESETSIKKNKKQDDSDQVLILILNSCSLFIQTFKELLHPYITTLIILCNMINPITKSNNQETSSLINTTIHDTICSYIEIRNLIEPLEYAVDLPNIIKINNLLYMKNLGYLCIQICNQLDKDTFEVKNMIILRILLKGLDFTRQYNQEKGQYLVNDDSDFSASQLELIEDSWIEAFSKFALKTNEIQLKKIFLKGNEWSNKVFKDEDNQFSLYRKIILFKLISKLFDVMKSFFVTYMSFVFDFIIEQLLYYNQYYSQTFKPKQSNKRKREEYDIKKDLNSRLYILILENLTKCFTYDKEEFIDSNKFERLTQPLVDQFDNLRIEGIINYDSLIENYLAPCILQLFELLKDDYKWKTLSYAILLKTRNENTMIKLSVLKMIMKMVEQLKTRIIVLISDILPFLAETIEDENIMVEKMSRDIIIRLEQTSGESFKDYLKYQAILKNISVQEKLDKILIEYQVIYACMKAIQMNT